MPTITFRLDGPMQAWSRQPRTHGGGGKRPTQTHPTKTGVIGLVANALGRSRTDDISDLTGLLYAVRVDREGTLERDYQTAGNGAMPLLPGDALTDPALAKKMARAADGARPSVDYAAPRKTGTDSTGRATAPTTGRTTVPSDSLYVADAAYTVALTGARDVIENVAEALTRPARLLHLGRVAYPTSGDLHVTVTDHPDPVDALTVPVPLDRDDDGPRDIWAETLPGPVVTDQPVNYDQRATNGRREGVTTTAPDQPTFFSPGGTA